MEACSLRFAAAWGLSSGAATRACCARAMTRSRTCCGCGTRCGPAGLPLPHLRRDRPHTWQRLRGDCTHPSHICTGTALAAATSSAPGTAFALTKSTPGTAEVKVRGRVWSQGFVVGGSSTVVGSTGGQSTDGLRPRPLPSCSPARFGFRLLGAPVAAGGHRALEAGAASEVGPDATAPGDMHRKSERAAHACTSAARTRCACTCSRRTAVRTARICPA